VNARHPVKRAADSRWSRREALLGLAAGAALAIAPRARAEGEGALERIRERGSLQVGLYQDMPPFHVGGRGIDAALGRALAEAMQLKFQPLPFAAGESMDDDLRNMVWKGHYLGWGPADVLLHVPLDAPLLRANPQVRVIAPYYRERVRLAVDRRQFPQGVESLAQLKGQRVAVAGLSLAGWLMLGAEHGALRDQLATHWADGAAAAQALQRGEVVAVAGLASELESVLHGDERFTLQALPIPRAPRDGWALGCAVKKNADDLALALQQAMTSLQERGTLQALFRDAGVHWEL
jgi:ABC-type amino acid transport substrate-binding protein